MTIAELNRLITSKKRREQRKASFDYVLADLIGRSVARVYNSANTMPTLSPTLFNKEEEEEKIQEQKDELSALRFKQFAQSFNKNFKEGKLKNE